MNSDTPQAVCSKTAECSCKAWAVRETGWNPDLLPTGHWIWASDPASLHPRVIPAWKGAARTECSNNNGCAVPSSALPRPGGRPPSSCLPRAAESTSHCRAGRGGLHAASQHHRCRRTCWVSHPWKYISVMHHGPLK